MERATPLFANGKQLLEVLPFGGSTDTVTRAPKEMHGWIVAALLDDPAGMMRIARAASFALTAGRATKTTTARKVPTEQSANANNARPTKAPD
jgi:hypothetical protein